MAVPDRAGAARPGARAGPCPDSRSSTAPATVWVGVPTVSALRVTGPAARVLNSCTEGDAVAVVTPARATVCSGPETNAVWKRIGSLPLQRRKPAPGVFGNWYASSVPNTIRDSLADRVFRHNR